ncbi:MAG: hypothetical protein KAQ68_11310 [Clostridiales bacterium]|nr:hypothetical protein [Clostridiales bacterium]
MRKAKKQVIVLCVVLLVVLVTMSIGAILLDDGGAPYETTSLRGEKVQIYGGNGLYKFDTVDKALMMRAYDLYYLCIGAAIMLLGLVLYIMNKMTGFFILISSLFFLIYSFIITSIGTAFNEFFLLYMLMYILSIFTVVLLIKDVTYEKIAKSVLPRLPIKTLAIFTLLLASYFIINWLIIDFEVLINGTIHPDVSIYTTSELNVTDLSIYAVLSVTGAIMLLKRKPLGAIFSIGIIIMAFQTLTALTIYILLNAKYHEIGIVGEDLPLIIFAVVCFIFSIIALMSIKGCKIKEDC